MIEMPSLSEHRIIDCLKTHYGIRVVRLVLLPLGADLNASVYKAEDEEGASYFVKIKLGHRSDISATIIDLLDQAGIHELILPLTTLGGQTAQALASFTMTVFPFIEGQDGFRRDLTDQQWLRLGKVMRQIHELTVPPPIQAIIRRESYSSQWREALRALYVQLESPPKGDEMARKFVAFMKEQAATIQRLLEQADLLSQKIQSWETELVLCHSDIHGGNVLLAENEAMYLVDWDDPIMAPKERDLMFIGGGVANVWNKPQEEELFYKGYGKVDINKTILAYYRCERIIEDLALFGQALLLAPESDPNRPESYQHFIAQFEPNGVVEIAIRSISAHV